MIGRHGAKTPVRATLLLPGPDRDAAIDEHARRHVSAANGCAGGPVLQVEPTAG